MTAQIKRHRVQIWRENGSYWRLDRTRALSKGELADFCGLLTSLGFSGVYAIGDGEAKIYEINGVRRLITVERIDP